MRILNKKLKTKKKKPQTANIKLSARIMDVLCFIILTFSKLFCENLNSYLIKQRASQRAHKYYMNLSEK